MGFLGYINNDTEVQGKAFIFNTIYESYPVFECILFVHPTVKPFITLPEFETAVEIDLELLLQTILTQYKLQDLLAYEN